MEMEVVGRHALLFDDDAMAAFVNSSDALVEWNSIPIDRYDVRHLLSSPPPPRRRNHHQIVDSLETELDLERYIDLSYHPQQEEEEDLKPVDAGGYNAVAFSYGNNEEESAAHKDSDSGLGSSAFCPPFPVPVDLVIPPTEKLHQIIARTAIYVSKHGAQSEIVLRVKQGDNPTFGFLMPDHHLHSYFRFLVDHSEVLHSGEKPQNDKISDTEPGVGGGALSLLGSLYGFGDDDDGAVEYALTSEEKASDRAITTHMSEKTASSKSISVDAVSNHPVNSQKEVPAKPKDKVFMLKRNSFTSGLKAGSGSDTRKEVESVVSHSATTSRSRSSSLAPTSMVEPPSEIKKMIAKIVEFIMKNGKQFEAVLIEQDSEHGRFPFLLPSSQYYQYYLKLLEEAQKSRVSGRASFNEKDGLGLHGSSKKTIVSKGSGSSLESAECEIPFDSDRKEKFKMVIGKSKNEGLDPPSKASQQQSEVGVDAAAAAAILQAATKGMRTPNLDFLSRSSLNRKDNNSEHVSSLGSPPTSQPQSIAQKSDQNGARALEAAGEADSLEANLTREQKLKAERLRRAKMFVAMIKSGSAPQIKPESSRGTSLEPCNVSGADAEDNRAAREREGGSAPLEIDATENIESAANKFSTDEYNERKARRKYRSNSSKHEAAKGDTDDEEDEVVHKHSRKKHRKEEKGVDEIEIKHSRKQHTHRASDYVSEQDRFEKYHRYSRKHRRSHRASHDGDEKDEVEHDDERDHKYSSKHHRSSNDEDEEEHEDRRSRKKHRSRRSSHDGDEKDEVEHDDERDYKYSRKHHRSYKSSNDEDEEEHEDRRSRKKHRSHHHSRHHSSRDSHGHKHRKKHNSSKDRESRRRNRHNITAEEENVLCIGSDELYGKVPRSEREDLEEGEISAKVSDQSRGSAGGAHREPSVDISSSFQDQRSSSQPLEPTEVSNDLRAKIRAMLLETL